MYFLNYSSLFKKRLLIATPQDFQGEYQKRSWFYIGILWLVSIWAMLTNYTQAFAIKFLKQYNKNSYNSINRVRWDMGRSSSHISSFAYDRFSRFNHQAKCGAAGWKALTLFYNYHDQLLPNIGNNLEGWLTHHWMGKMENRQAVTNRKKIVVDLLQAAFKKFASESEVRLISVASGSAQAVVEAIKENPESDIKAVLIDLDKSALEEAQKLAKSEGLEKKFQFIRGTYKTVKNISASPPILSK